MQILNDVPTAPESETLHTAGFSDRDSSHLLDGAALPPLSPTQHRVLNEVEQYIAVHGYPPSIGDLVNIVGLAKSTVEERLKALARRGYIRRDPGVDRGIAVLASAKGARVVEPKTSKPAEQVEHLCGRCRRVMTEPGLAKARPRANAGRKVG